MDEKAELEPESEQNTKQNACCDAAELCKGLNQLREKRLYCDVELQIEDEIYPCHKIVIVNSSNFFNTMFNSSFREKKSHLIPLSGDIDPSVFKEVLEFLYIADTNITEKNVYGLLRSSHYLQIEKLEERCYNYILNNPNIEHLLEIIEYCVRLGKQDCAEIAIKHCVLKIRFLQKSDYFFKISHTLLCSILKTAKQRNFNGCPRQEYIDAIFEWTKSSWMDRKCYLKDLMKCVVPSNDFSIPFLETFSELLLIENKVLSYPPLEVFCATESNSTGIDKLIYNEASYVWKSHICRSVENFKVVRFDNSDYYLSWTFQDGKNVFWKDGSGDSTRVKLTVPFVNTRSYDITIANRKMYFYNFSFNSPPVALYEYEFSRDRWFSVSDVPEELFHSYLISFDEIVYLIGGCSEFWVHSAKRNVIQCYDKRSPNWIVKYMDKHFLLNGTACVYRNEIYIYEKSISKQGYLYVYNPVAGKLRSVDITYFFTTPGILVSSDHELWYLEKKNLGRVYSIINKNEYVELNQIPTIIETASGSTRIKEIKFARFC